MPYVYILKCRDNTYYCGITKNLNNRVSQHVAGSCKYTRYRRPLHLVWFYRTPFMFLARKLEVKIKSIGPGRFIKSRMRNTRYTKFIKQA